MCIDSLCAQFSSLFVLWDGAFSYASKSVHAHMQEDLSVTPKVHLMWKHVELQMRLPGGLAWKREDWVEHMHQVTNRLRTQFSTTKNRDTRSTAMAQDYQQNTHPESNAWKDKVTGDSKRSKEGSCFKGVIEKKVEGGGKMSMQANKSKSKYS